MKTLHLSIITIGVIIGIIVIVIIPFSHTGIMKPSMPAQVNNTTLNVKQNVSTVIIPKGSENVISGKNYEPTYLVVVLGINNTVLWVNHGETMNSIAADNQNDPNFFDATSKQTYMNVQEDNNVNPPNFLRSGESFEYTFTKSGFFGYHGTHTWQHGWVIVLPPSATSVVTTVTLNDSNVLGPCEIFALPCPQGPHIFTAQQFGSDIYIEKMTINGVDNYVVVKHEGFCVYPPSHSSHSCTNPDDLAILRLAGVDISNPPVTNSTLSEQLGHTCIGGPGTCP